MKDAKGHGSNGRGGGGIAHQTGIAHALVSKGQAFGKLATRFARDTSGSGHPPVWLETAVEEAAKEPSTYIHAAHFFSTLAAIAIADVIVQCVAYAIGVIPS